MPKKKVVKKNIKANPVIESDTDSQGTGQGVLQYEQDENLMDSKDIEKESKEPKLPKKKVIKTKVEANPVPESDTDSQGTDQGVQ